MTRQQDGALLSGRWPGGAQWEFFLSDRLPEPPVYTSVACVPIRSLEDGEVVLTYNTDGRGTASPGSWEMPGGHLDPRDPNHPDGPRETPPEARDRETLEEAGFVVATAGLFGYRRVVNPIRSKYPPLSHTLFYWGFTEERLRTPTDPGSPACGTFRLEAIQALERAGAMQASELVIIEYGFAAAVRHVQSQRLDG